MLTSEYQALIGKTSSDSVSYKTKTLRSQAQPSNRLFVPSKAVYRHNYNGFIAYVVEIPLEQCFNLYTISKTGKASYGSFYSLQDAVNYAFRKFRKVQPSKPQTPTSYPVARVAPVAPVAPVVTFAPAQMAPVEVKLTATVGEENTEIHCEYLNPITGKLVSKKIYECVNTLQSVKACVEKVQRAFIKNYANFELNFTVQESLFRKRFLKVSRLAQ